MKQSGFFKINFIYFVSLVMFVVLNIVFVAAGVDFAGRDVVSSLLIQVGFMFLLPLGLCKLIFKTSTKAIFSDVRFKKISIKHIFISIGLGVCLYVISLYVATIFNTLLGLFGYSGASSGASEGPMSVGSLFLSIFLSCVLPAFCEEFLHRGVLFSGLNKQVGVKKAVVISAVLFALMHLNISQFGYAFVAGLLLGYVTFLTGSIFPAMIMHFMNNFIGTYLSFSMSNQLPLGKVVNAMFGASSFGSSLLFSALIFIVVVMLFRWLLNIMLTDIHRTKFIEARSQIVKEYLRVELLKGEQEAKNLFLKTGFGFTSFEEVEIAGKKRIIEIKVPLSAVGIATSVSRKPSFAESVFYYANLFVGIAVTILTLFWGVM